MKYLSITITFLILLSSFTGCKKKGISDITDPVSSNKLKITVGSSVFTASLYDNATTIALIQRLPLTLNMSELNGNEKLYDFSNSFPSNPSNPGSIQNGDIMLYGSRTLVLFYKSFPTSYSYTRIGKIDDVSGYAAALGSGSISVTLELN